jgi:hypothetical protein
MIIDTTEIQDINSFYRVESLKEVYGIIWVLVPILSLVLGITIGFARGSSRSVFLMFFQFYVKHDLRKNKIVVSFFC